MEDQAIEILRKHGCLYMKDDYKELFKDLELYYRGATPNIDLTSEQINDLMVTALEGGINYWCGGICFKDGSLLPEQEYNYLSEVISLGGTLILEDLESDDTWELTKEKFLKGLEKTLELGNYNSVQELFDNHDAETVDVLIQYALFDEIVFG